MTSPSARVAVLALLAVLAAALLAPAPALAASPPTILATSATNLQGISALLAGKVGTAGMDTTYSFEYVDEATFAADQPNGFAQALSTPSAPLSAAIGERAVSAAVSGLAPDTTYHYRLRAENAAGPATGPDQTFTTTAGFGFLPGAAGFDVAVNGEGGATPDTLAGSHPYSIATTVNFNQAGEVEGQPGVPVSDGNVRDLQLELPPGLIENPSAVSKCSQAQFHAPRSSPFEASLSGESCPALSQIGMVEVRSSADGGSARSFGLFNLTPPPGFPAQIGASPFGIPITLTPRIRDAGGEYGVTLELSDFSQRLDIYGLTLTVWGVPWATAHNAQRGNCLNEAEASFGFAKCPISPPAPEHGPQAYLTLPASCAAPLSFAIAANSWQQPATVSANSLSRDGAGRPAALEGCAGLAFEPLASGQVTNPRASSPSGFDFSLSAQEAALSDRKLRVPSQTKEAVVSLPEGMTLNPSLAAGLGVCAAAGYGAETATSAPGAGCPNAAKIGTFTVQSPLVEETLSGSIFLAQPYQNPFGSLLALYLVAKAPQRGLIVKVAGRLSADPASGRLTATFDDLPQLPYSDLKIHFREGQRSPLVTPAACGTYSTQIDLEPWSASSGDLDSSSPFGLAAGLGPGGACPAGGPAPFDPGAQGGTLNSNAGSYTPFYLHLTRTDSEQEITSYSALLPPGLLGRVAGIPYCPEADIEAAKALSGVQEEEHPSCPAASEIGHTYSGYGVGGVLAYAPGRLYLAGPYHGAPLSIVAIDAATVGPFDLGVIVVRSAIEVNPASAQISIDSAASDPIPHIIDGIPIHLRDVRIYISRPEFTLNPTSCEPFSVVSTLTGSAAPFTDPRDISAAVADRFQVSNCSALGFAPRFGLSLKGGTKRGDYPQLSATVTPRPGDANIGAAAVTLPGSIFLAQNHIKTICSHTQFAAGACPRGSIYGQAMALTPLLSNPLRGPVYLRSSDNPLPDLVASLHGDGVQIEVVGRIDSFHGGIRGRFEGLPDAPVTKFTIKLKGGRRGILADADDICASPQRAIARFLGQNNGGERLRPRVRARCPKSKKGGRG